MEFPQPKTFYNILEICQILESQKSHRMAMIRNNNLGLELYDCCSPSKLTRISLKEESPMTRYSCYDNKLHYYQVRGGEIFDQTEEFGSPESIAPEHRSEKMISPELVPDEISLQSKSNLQRSDHSPITRRRRRHITMAAIGPHVLDEIKTNDSNPKNNNLWSAARRWIGRLSSKWICRKQQLDGTEHSDENQYNFVGHNFDELDEILKNNNKTHSDDEVDDDSSDKLSQTGGHGANKTQIEDWWAGNFPSIPPKDALLRKGWNRRAFRSWLYKMELKFLSEGTRKALKTIYKIIGSFEEYGVVNLLGLYSPKDVILSVVALSRLQRILAREIENDTNSNTAIDKYMLEELAHYSIFANAAYGWRGQFAFFGRLHFGDINALVKRTGIDKSDVITANWHSKVNRPAYFIVRDVKRRSIVLSIRGTMSPRDILTDLCASTENFIVEDCSDGNFTAADAAGNIATIGDIGCDGESQIDTSQPLQPSIVTKTTYTKPPLIIGRAHKGMIDAAKSVGRVTGKIITEELRSHPDYSLVILGHSLGGGVAAVLAAMWSRRFPGRVKSYGYGNPCVFPLDWCRSSSSFSTLSQKNMDECNNIVSVIGEGDPFSRISLGHLADISKALSLLCQDKGFRDEILKRTDIIKSVDSIDKTDRNYVWLVNAMAFLPNDMIAEKLFPPGQIYVMSGSLIEFNAETRANLSMIRKVEANTFRELQLHARMFDLTLHIPARYESVLQRLSKSNT
ncbi:hypothetical protein ACHAXS_012247 [Conticribra weissflogii]